MIASLMRKIHFVLLFILLFIIVNVFFFKENKILIKNSDKNNLQTGDIILIRGQSFLSKVVNLFDLNSTDLSHVGLIYITNNIISVIHASPDKKENGKDGIRIDEFQGFIDLSDVSEYKILRLNMPYNKKIMLKIIEKYKKKDIFFDFNFDMVDSTDFYCSELILRIYDDLGIQLLDSIFYKKMVIYPSEFLNSNKLYKIKQRKSIITLK